MSNRPTWTMRDITNRNFEGNAVSILARPSGRALPLRAASSCRSDPVSILARPEGRALRD